MKSFLKRESLHLLLMLLPFIYLGYRWSELPDTVAVHYNLKGEADRFGHKAELWLIPVCLSLLTYLLLLLVPVIDPKKRIEAMGIKYTRLRFSLGVVICALALVLLHNASAAGNQLSGLFPLILGALFAVLGNYFKTLQPNYFIGIRTPWTLESERVWKETHLVTGRLWFAGGIFMMLAALIFKGEVIGKIQLSLILLLALFPVVYSFLRFRRHQELP